MSKKLAALFDLDGVIFDTEGQYDIFWGSIGKKYLPQMPEFSKKIKGTTLPQILSHFQNPQDRTDIEIELNEFEHNMPYNYINGAKETLQAMRTAGIKTAVVTSSNDIKMENVFRNHPDFKQMFDTMITANKVTKSKPDPQCYLLAAQELDMLPDNCVVFEDSFHGLESGRRAKMTVVGLATTNPRNLLSGKADIIIDDFSCFKIEEVF